MFTALALALAVVAPEAVLVDVDEGSFVVGSSVFVAVDGANLREAADANGKLKGIIDFHTPATVLEVKDPPVVVGGLRQRWYRVKTAGVEGWLFGNTLTTLVGKRNLDADAADEEFVVVINKDAAPLVRVFNPEDVIALSTAELPRLAKKAKVSLFDVPSVGGIGLVGVKACTSTCDVSVVAMQLRTPIIVLSAPKAAPSFTVAAKGKSLVVAGVSVDVAAVIANTQPTVRPAPTDAQLASFFDRGCGNAVTVDIDMMGSPEVQSACIARDFNQNCSPDKFGCDAAEEKCLDRCAAPCESCELSCASTCGGCKDKCGDDLLCRHACSQSRGTCHKACVSRATSCRTSGACGREHTACVERAAKRKADECDAEVCAAYNSCVSTGPDFQPPGGCDPIAAKLSPFCLEACYEQ